MHVVGPGLIFVFMYMHVVGPGLISVFMYLPLSVNPYNC